MRRLARVSSRNRGRPFFNITLRWQCLCNRLLTAKLTNAQIDFLLGACGRDGLAEILRQTADFDSHKRFILQFCRHPLFWKILRGA